MLGGTISLDTVSRMRSYKNLPRVSIDTRENLEIAANPMQTPRGYPNKRNQAATLHVRIVTGTSNLKRIKHQDH